MFLGPHPDVPCNNNPPKIYKKGARASSFLPARVEAATWQCGGSHVCRPGGRGSGHVQRIRHITHPLKSMSSSSHALGPGDMAEGPWGACCLWLRWRGLSQVVAEQKPRHCSPDHVQTDLTSCQLHVSLGSMLWRLWLDL